MIVMVCKECNSKWVKLKTKFNMQLRNPDQIKHTKL